MKTLPHMFTDLTALLEDLHGVAVEGQAQNLTPDIHAILLGCIRPDISRLNEIAASIGQALPRGNL